MGHNFNNKTASRLHRWASIADTPEEGVYLEKLAQLVEDPTAQAGLSDDQMGGDVSPAPPMGDMAAMQGSPVDLSTGAPEEAKGEYDITREPASPMWNVELLRIKANTSEEAQQIVEKFVGWARDHGQPRISVGTIKRCRDDDDKSK